MDTGNIQALVITQPDPVASTNPEKRLPENLKITITVAIEGEPYQKTVHIPLQVALQSRLTIPVELTRDSSMW